MPRSSRLSHIKSKLAAVAIPKAAVRDPRLTARIVLGVLLAANLVAAVFVFRPWADSPEQLAQQLAETRRQMIQRKANIERLKILVGKSDIARKEGDNFLGKYFFARRTAASTLISELSTMAKAAGVRPKEHSFAFEQVEGSDTVAMMTITANYEGTYADLVQYVNKIDRSQRFFIIENVAAVPQQGGTGVLNINMKVNVFIREDGTLPTVAENKPPAPPTQEARP